MTELPESPASAETTTLQEEVVRLLAHSRHGDLSERGDPTQVAPSDRKVLAAVNELLDRHEAARTEALALIAEVTQGLTAVSQGDLRPRLEPPRSNIGLQPTDLVKLAFNAALDRLSQLVTKLHDDQLSLSSATETLDEAGAVATNGAKETDKQAVALAAAADQASATMAQITLPLAT